MTIPRLEVIELAHYAAQNGERGSEINRVVAEGRDVGRYSSCGDLLHCVAFAAGMRDPTINRAEYQGWQRKVNISRWLKWAKPAPALADLLPGDFLIYNAIGNGERAHVCVWLTKGLAGEALTADYGQPGGALRVCHVSRDPRLHVRGQLVTHAVSLARLPWTATPLNVGAWLEVHGLDPSPWFEGGLRADEICTDDEIDAINREGT